jgi:hypothetical protein
LSALRHGGNRQKLSVVARFTGGRRHIAAEEFLAGQDLTTTGQVLQLGPGLAQRRLVQVAALTDHDHFLRRSVGGMAALGGKDEQSAGGDLQARNVTSGNAHEDSSGR